MPMALSAPPADAISADQSQRFSVKDNLIGDVVELVVAATNALVTWFQQVLVHFHHSETEKALHCDDELWQFHLIILAF